MARGARWSRRRRSLRWHLVALVLAVLLPALGAGGFAAWQAVRAYRGAFEARLQDTARALALALDNDIEVAQTALTALTATAERAEDGDLAAFHAHARQVGEAFGAVVVLQAAGQPPRPLVNTRLPFGAPLPPPLMPAEVQRTAATGRPVVTNLVLGPISQRALVAVFVPVPRRAGHEPLVIGMDLRPARLSRVLEAQRLSGDGYASLVDANQVVVARSREQARFAGRAVPAWFAAAVRGEHGVARGETLEGAEAIFGYQRLTRAPGWLVAVAEPYAAYQASWQGPLLALLLGGAAALALALTLAALLAHRVIRPIAALAHHAEMVATGEHSVEPPPAPVAEFETLHRSLARASAVQQAAEAALRTSERRYRVLAETGSVALWRATPSGSIIESRGWEVLTGQSSEDLRDTGWAAAVHPEDRVATIATWAVACTTEKPVDTEYRIRTRSGEWRWVRGRGVPIFENGEIIEWVGVVEDMHERRSAEAEARRLALHDPLTGLPNRRLLDEQGPALLARARREGAAVAVLALDLDRFKPVNDLHGHAAGDVVLREVAERLRGILRESDAVARTGGDEFVVAAELGSGPDASVAEAAARLARRVLAALAGPVPLDGGETAAVGTSIGIALAEAWRVKDFEALLRQADAALYRAKAEGRGTFHFHEAGMDALRRARARTEAELRRALPVGEIEPHYQPLVDLETGRIESFEVLARWRHPRRGLLMPAEFISVAEDAGLIGLLTEAVLRRAAAEAANWGAPLPIAVNLSALLLHDAGLVERVLGILAEAGLPPERLEVEVTETAVVPAPERARCMAIALKAAGVRLAMDDFGTGYSSLASLRALPFDRIKIDRSFVSDLGEGADGEKIVAAIVALGRSLGLPTVAEGIEDATTARRAKALGCHVGQGWHFGRPMPASEVSEFLAGSAAHSGGCTA